VTTVDEVRYERIGSVAVLTIDRPERRNAVDGPTAQRLAVPGHQVGDSGSRLVGGLPPIAV
jgi:enoyl-CoA hydratase/carnithine racemase